VFKYASSKVESMRAPSALSDQTAPRNRFFLPALVASNFAGGALPLLASLLLIDIGNTFNASVGATAQINTLYSIAAVIFAIMMGALSIRFKRNFLLLTGLMFNAISAVGCFLAQNFSMMMASYALNGVGWAMLSPMSLTLIGEHYPIERRARAVGSIVAAGALVYVIGAPLIALTANQGGWRFSILALVIPISLVSLLLGWIGLHSADDKNKRSSLDWRAYLNSFSKVLSNHSALACLTGDFFRSASFVAIVIYSASFGRQRFLQSREFASIVILTAALCYTIGGLACGLILNRIGRKKSVVISAFLSGTLTILYVFTPYQPLYIALVFGASLFFGVVASSANSLSLEQVPTLRGTMMSIDTASLNLGSAFGTVIGELALVAFNYEGLGLALGTMGITASLAFTFFAKDPTRIRSTA
jgi:DHA1 family inner membrane transport protein